MASNGIRRRIVAILSARYWPNEGHVPAENLFADFFAVVTSQYTIWTVTTPWLDIEYYPRASLAIAALTLTLYGIMWSVIVKSPTYKALSPARKFIEAIIRLIAIASITLGFFFLNRGSTVIFVFAFAISFASVLLWNVVVPSQLRRERGLVFHDCCLFISGIFFCYSTWTLYSETTKMNQSLHAAAAQLVQADQINFKNGVIVSQMGWIIFVACSTTAVLIALLAALFSRSDDYGGGRT
ncbi:hypothetical protein [Bradyrhizobium sp. 930_D9_N1_4]|uniref:hypothetical protein n=1 Tax=Bradyrhizobium sp. 930_D9_N1_4 TaxID=3240374 RepID=UPI003F8C9E1B